MTCCVTGHRPKGFFFPRENTNPKFTEYLDQLRGEIERLIHEEYHDFLTGMADGADLDFAKAVLSFCKEDGNLRLKAVLPYPIVPAKRMSSYTKERDAILTLCHQVHVTSPYYHKGCMHKRNRFMVDQADLVLAIWNGTHSGGTWDTIQYACKQGKPVRYILLDSLNE